MLACVAERKAAPSSAVAGRLRSYPSLVPDKADVDLPAVVVSSYAVGSREARTSLDGLVGRTTHPLRGGDA